MRAGAFSIGYIIDDKYEVVDHVGTGGFGTVLKVKQLEDEQVVALKYCLADSDSEDYERFCKEIAALERLYADNIIRIMDFETSGTPPYYVMPLAEASLVDTAALLRDSETALLAIFKQICNGVRNLHDRGCFHRDIKPSNVLMLNGIPHVADFGLVKFQSATTTAITVAALGTLEYAAPEQFTPEGAQKADARSDIFSLGKLLYWLYTGRSPSHMDYDLLPERIRPVVLKCTRVEPSERYQTVSNLLDVIEYHENFPTVPTEVVVDRAPKSYRDQLSQTIASLQNGRPDAGSKVRRFMDAFCREINVIAPDFQSKKDDPPDELLIRSIDDSLLLTTDFCRLADSISQMNALEPAEALFRSFEALLKGYDLPEGFSGGFNDYFFDYAKFISQELFVSFIGLLVRDERWDILTAILANPLCLELRSRGNECVTDYTFISEHIELLRFRNDRLKLRRVSLHADILYNRHSGGELGELVPSALFADADYLLYLRSISNQIAEDQLDLCESWYPWSFVYLRSQGPKFLHYAKSKRYAMKLLPVLSLDTIEELRRLLKNHGRGIERALSAGGFPRVSPIAKIDPITIGTLP